MSTPKLLLATSMVAFSAFISSCGDGGKALREKATADSLALVASQDSIAAVEKAEEDSIAAAAAAAAPKTIVYVANQSAIKLAAAIKAADLEATLGDTAQKFTVFAPSDEAFTAAQASVDELLKPENKAKLQELLKNHVIVGSFKAAALKDGQTISTAGGSRIKIKKTGDKVSVDGANVTTADVETANGVIHIIDKVLTPKK
jgi:uncharacterized surface protein with fasciclin (FAS1) repeats